MTQPIKWTRRGIAWRSDDFLYSVGETYSGGSVKYRACLHASVHNVRPLGEIRDTAEEAMNDAQAEADRIAALQVPA